MLLSISEVCCSVLISSLFVIAIFPRNSNSSNSCSNGGVLQTDAQGVQSCFCLAGYYGEHCENVLRSFSCSLDSDCADSSSVVVCENGACVCLFKGKIPLSCENSESECTEDAQCMNDGSCNRNSRCVCKQGFTGGEKCVDVNECMDYQEAVCTDPDLPICVNTAGSFTCVSCGHSCEDKIKTAACRAINDNTVPNGCAPFLQ